MIFKLLFSLFVPALNQFMVWYEIRLANHSFMLSNFPVFDRCLHAYSKFLRRPKKALILSESCRPPLYYYRINLFDCFYTSPSRWHQIFIWCANLLNQILNVRATRLNEKLEVITPQCSHNFRISINHRIYG